MTNSYELLNEKDLFIFDMDGTTVSVRTRDFLKEAQNGGEVIYTSYELPKSFIVTAESSRRAPKRRRVYVTQYLPQTVVKHIRTNARTQTYEVLKNNIAD